MGQQPSETAFRQACGPPDFLVVERQPGIRKCRGFQLQGRGRTSIDHQLGKGSIFFQNSLSSFCFGRLLGSAAGGAALP
jgi:hypothetical protein